MITILLQKTFVGKPRGVVNCMMTIAITRVTMGTICELSDMMIRRSSTHATDTFPVHW